MALRVPRFWARSEPVPVRARRRQFSVSVWGWSETDPLEAARVARERAARLVERVRGGLHVEHDYDYGRTPPREELVDELRDAAGELVGIVTRNQYGSLILTTDRAMFVDVDLPRKRPFGWLRRLFGGAGDADAAALARLRSALERTAPGGFRIYRTAAGFRALVTSRTDGPVSDVSVAAMEAAGADAAYVRLCRAQGTYRARLTPKPWRCGQPRPPGRFPREGSAERAAFERWRAEYDRACEARATCRLVEVVGSGAVPDAIVPVLACHDALTRIDTTLPLA